MYIYKEPFYPPVSEIDITDKFGALSQDQLDGWIGNKIKLAYRPEGWTTSDIEIRHWSTPTISKAQYFLKWRLGGSFYGGYIDVTGGYVYSLFDSNGDYLEEPDMWINAYVDEYGYGDEGPLNVMFGSTSSSEKWGLVFGNNLSTEGMQFLFVTQCEEVEMNIVTGYVGEPHITAAQDRAANQGSYGEDSYILNVGSKLAATASSATEIHIADGAVSHQGCVGVIDQGTYDVVEISPGSQGYKRIDLIVCRYERNSDTNEESLSLVAIQGTPAASNPAVPAHTQGDIQGGDLIADMPLFQVLLNGITIQSITNVANSVLTQAELTAAVNALEDDIVMEASGNLLASSQTIATMKQVAVEVTVPTKTGYSIIAASPRTLTGASNTKVMMELDVQTGYLKLFNTHTSSVTISAAAFNIIYKKN